MKTRSLMNSLSRVGRAAVIASALALALPLSACAGSNRQSYMYDHGGAHVYERPMAEVWAAAKQMLSEEGYSGRDVPGGWVYVTEWKESGGGSSISSAASRYMIEGKELSPSRCTVHFTRVVRSAAPTTEAIGRMQGPGESSGTGQAMSLSSGQRDLEMEWRLLGKLDPGAASSIEAQARREYPGD